MRGVRIWFGDRGAQSSDNLAEGNGEDVGGELAGAFVKLAFDHNAVGAGDNRLNNRAMEQG